MHDDRSPAEEMVHELGIAPGLEVDDNPLLEQARRNVADTADRSRERTREQPHDPEEESETD
ncbi:MAG TPA: hypothetical protein VGN14_18600 [Candidatus Elarobacter sp.]|jgi:hypothetical protein